MLDLCPGKLLIAERYIAPYLCDAGNRDTIRTSVVVLKSRNNGCLVWGTTRNGNGSVTFHFVYVHQKIGGARGSVVVKALCYKPEGLGFDSR
jgi:hypothetical protein